MQGFGFPSNFNWSDRSMVVKNLIEKKIKCMWFVVDVVEYFQDRPRSERHTEMRQDY